MIEEAKLTYSPLENILGKQRKTIEDQGEKQIKAIKNRVKKKIVRNRSSIERFFVFKTFYK